MAIIVGALGARAGNPLGGATVRQATQNPGKCCNCTTKATSEKWYLVPQPVTPKDVPVVVRRSRYICKDDGTVKMPCDETQQLNDNVGCACGGNCDSRM